MTTSDLSNLEIQLAQATAEALSDGIMHELANETSWLAENQRGEQGMPPLSMIQVVEREIDAVGDGLVERRDYATLIGYPALTIVLLAEDFMAVDSKLFIQVKILTEARVKMLKAQHLDAK